jgi:flagellar biosynthetic protein FlhB
MATEDRSQRTEKPTPRRLQKAREKGQVARSAEIPGVLVLAGFLIFCRVAGGGWLDRMEGMLVDALGGLAIPDITPTSLIAIFRSTAGVAGALLLPPLGVLAAAGVAGNLLQGPPPLTLEPLKPNFGRLDPVKNFGRVFSLRQWVEVLKVLVKTALYGTVAFTAARDAILSASEGAPGAEGTLLALLRLSGTVVFRVTLLAAVLAVLDWMFRRYDHVRSLMMSKKEIRDEYKEMEGDPLIRSRIRSKQLALARSRMMADVPKATVVVTNPTHFAVALRYVPGETEVPKVLAKGRAKLAERIREIAAAHKIPIVSDPPLARSLYKSVPLGGEIPVVLYRAVAEVLALILHGKGRGRRAPATGEEARP